MLGLSYTKLFTNGFSKALTRSTFLKATYPAAFKSRAMFHTSKSLSIGKAVPNPETVPVMPVEKSALTEQMVGKMLSISLVPLIGVAVFYGPQSLNDLLLGIVFPLHAYIGVKSSIVDYFPKRRTPVLYRIFSPILAIGTLFALYGCWVINTTDVGITALVAKVWHARNKNVDE
ncbi:hypothetical protein BB561_000457 [Smittium simulii]|uniref:Succinate dehydrogenase [ubiquinone] cytochrome b small subunit n=1 Tax=Smittium simulii TaxID=133385 RepID=A0A2T9YZ80_9FUNG|nr:hypothetical protein BB561_000457 [Smittium simulii]